jgi:hypothetical protein
MSQTAERKPWAAGARRVGNLVGSTVGNTARSLQLPQRGDEQPGRTRQRTPLSVVPAPTRRRRIPFALVCCVPLLLALAAVLFLNIRVSAGQYELVTLHNTQIDLSQENQSLTQQVENQRAPQNLAAKAAELGMVAAPSSGTIDLNTMQVAGKPQPAPSADKPTERIAAPELSGSNRAATQDAQKASGQQPAGTGTAQESGTTDSTAQDSTAQNSTGQAAGAPAPQGGTAEAPATLNGGSIPAPKQQTGR